MKVFITILLLCPWTVRAAFLFNYGLNYSSETKGPTDNEYEGSKTFHKLFLGASVNQRKTLYFGWNINQWSSKNKQGETELEHSILEMGPRVHWYLNENQNWYISAEWSPYARGDRRTSEDQEVSGSSMGFGLGYRFRLSRLVGLGASIQYHSLSLDEEKVESTENDISDKATHLMPMLEFSILTK